VSVRVDSWIVTLVASVIRSTKPHETSRILCFLFLPSSPGREELEMTSDASLIPRVREWHSTTGVINRSSQAKPLTLTQWEREKSRLQLCKGRGFSGAKATNEN
jgi:hypothetical protein